MAELFAKFVAIPCTKGTLDDISDERLLGVLRLDAKRYAVAQRELARRAAEAKERTDYA